MATSLIHSWLIAVVAIAAIGADSPPQPAASKPKAATKANPPEFVLYKDKSWTHIGDGRFSPQSNGASDLTAKLAGKSHTVKISLDAKAIAEAADPRWKSVVLTGSVIGNDTGFYGQTTPTVVELAGSKIGEITRSGLFRISFDKKLLTADPKKPMTLKITSGENSAKDADDQELGTFQLILSKKPLPPKPKKPSPKTEPKAGD